MSLFSNQTNAVKLVKLSTVSVISLFLWHKTSQSRLHPWPFGCFSRSQGSAAKDSLLPHQLLWDAEYFIVYICIPIYFVSSNYTLYIHMYYIYIEYKHWNSKFSYNIMKVRNETQNEKRQKLFPLERSDAPISQVQPQHLEEFYITIFHSVIVYDNNTQWYII